MGKGAHCKERPSPYSSPQTLVPHARAKASAVPKGSEGHCS